MSLRTSGAHMLFTWNYNASGWENQGKTAVLARAVPLGLDLHTLRDGRTSNGKTWWGEPKMQPPEQLAVLCIRR